MNTYRYTTAQLIETVRRIAREQIGFKEDTTRQLFLAAAELGRLSEHVLSLEPQPIADQWMARCPCGWVKTESSNDNNTRDETLRKLKLAFAVHYVEEVLMR